MVAAMTRRLQSLRKMRPDHGWIHTLLEEAENERMHMLTALDLKEPSMFFLDFVSLHHKCIDNGTLKMWANMAAPPIAKNYWHLKNNAMMRDVILVIRADEAHHRLVNHTLSSIKPTDNNPYLQPSQKK